MAKLGFKELVPEAQVRKKEKEKKAQARKMRLDKILKNLQDGHIMIIIFAGGPHNHLLPLPQPSKLQL